MPDPINTITIRTPDDFHVHFRQGEMLSHVVPFTSNVFRRAMVMPNTTPAILTGEDALQYSLQILKAANKPGFEPLMTIKLTKDTTPDTIICAKKCGVIAAKLYPEGVTTNSDDGLSSKDMASMRPVFSAMQECGMVLSLHGEVPGQYVLDREALFLETLEDLAMSYRRLRIVMEHITTSAAVIAVEKLPKNVAATITLHHLMLTLNDVLCDKRGGNEFLNPHHYCKPVAKRAEDRASLLWAATISGNPKFFFGSDTAPHLREKKESDCGCAGVWSAPVAIELLAHVFDRESALSKLEPFVSEFGARFYGLPLNEGTVTLSRLSESEGPLMAPLIYGIVPFWAGKKFPWYIVSRT